MRKRLEWLTVKQAAEIKQVDVTSVRNAIRRGDLMAQRAGERAWMIHPADLARWTPRKRKEATHDAGDS